MKKRLVPDGYFFMLLLLGILLHFIFPMTIIIPFPFDLIGIFPIVIGFLTTFKTNILLLKKKTAIMPFEIPNSLVTSGPFRISRNPIYLGMAVVLTGVCVVLGSLTPFVIPLVFIVVMDRSFIPEEERNLEKKFGNAYVEYKGRVRRWI